MLQSRGVCPGMMGAPWLDVPTKMAESELSALESNYERMLETIRSDTFGGQMPPKYNLEHFSSFCWNQNKHNKLSLELNQNESIHIYNDEDSPERTGGLDISFNRTMHSLNANENALSLHFDDDAEINLSVQRVRTQLNMNRTRTSSPSLSPIQRSRDNSIIGIAINLDHEMEPDDDEEKEHQNEHNLSLPFMTPSDERLMDSSNLLVFASTHSVIGCHYTFECGSGPLWR